MFIRKKLQKDRCCYEQLLIQLLRCKLTAQVVII